MHVVNVGYRSVNYYVLGTGEKRLLVDVGWPGSLPLLLAELKRKDIPLNHIRFLLATHYHPDHAGLAQELKAKGVRLVVLETQGPAIPLLKNVMKPEMHYQDITLHDNLELTFERSRGFLETLALAGQIVPTPGHSDDSVSLVLDEGVAFTGDLQPSFMSDDPATVESWERLRSLGVTRVYPGHGPAPRSL